MIRLGHATPESMTVYTPCQRPGRREGLPAGARGRPAVSRKTARAASSPTPDPSCPQHYPDAEYTAFVAGLSGCSAETRRKHTAFYRRFARTYPDLRTWFDQPLRDRLGWRSEETQNQRRRPSDDFDPTIGWINYNARPYLIYLALTGRLRRDWGWLLGIGVLKPWLVADQLGLPLNGHAAELY